MYDAMQCVCVLFISLCHDQQKKEVVNGKHITKNFQYDSPGECVLTYLSKVLFCVMSGLCDCLHTHNHTTTQPPSSTASLVLVSRVSQTKSISHGT